MKKENINRKFQKAIAERKKTQMGEKRTQMGDKESIDSVGEGQC